MVLVLIGVMDGAGGQHLGPYLRNERSYRLAVFFIVSGRTRRFERAQARLGRCTRCPAMLRTPSFHPLQLVWPLPLATVDFSGYELDQWDSINNLLCLAPLLRPQVRSLFQDLLCSPPPPPRPFVSLHYPQRSARGVQYVVRKLLTRAFE